MVDDPITERVRKNTQIVSDAAYKGVHPHIVEMDRRPGIIVGKLLNTVVIEGMVGKINPLFMLSRFHFLSFFTMKLMVELQVPSQLLDKS